MPPHLEEKGVLFTELGSSTGTDTVQGQKTRGWLTHAKIHHLRSRGDAVLAILNRGGHGIKGVLWVGYPRLA